MKRRLLSPLVLAAGIVGSGAALAQAETAAGQAFFDRHCAACHQPAGKGLPGLAPAVAGVLGPLLAHDEGRQYVLQVMVRGISGPLKSQGQLFNLAMPPQAGFSDTELAEAARYLASLNGSTESFSAADVARARGTTVTHKQMRELRERLLK